MYSDVQLIWECWPASKKQIKGDFNFFLNICSHFKGLFVVNFVSSGREFLYILWVPLAQGKWKHSVGISNGRQIPTMSLFHSITPIPLGNICCLWMMLENAPVRQVSSVTSHLWVFSPSQISSANWSRAALHGSKISFYFLDHVEIGGRYSVICCDRGRKIFLKEDLFPSQVGVGEGNLSLDLHGAFLA